MRAPVDDDDDDDERRGAGAAAAIVRALLRRTPAFSRLSPGERESERVDFALSLSLSLLLLSFASVREIGALLLPGVAVVVVVAPSAARHRRRRVVVLVVPYESVVCAASREGSIALDSARSLPLSSAKPAAVAGRPVAARITRVRWVGVTPSRAA